MKGEKIYMIIEAFSMQPRGLYVGKNMNNRTVAEIKLEIFSIANLGDREYYVGRDEEGNKMFEYLRESVNVQFV